MTEYTTIQVDRDTKDDLEALKRADGESFNSVVQRLIDGNVGGDLDEDRVREIAREEINDGVVFDALDGGYR